MKQMRRWGWGGMEGGGGMGRGTIEHMREVWEGRTDKVKINYDEEAEKLWLTSGN